MFSRREICVSCLHVSVESNNVDRLELCLVKDAYVARSEVARTSVESFRGVTWTMFLILQVGLPLATDGSDVFHGSMFGLRCLSFLENRIGDQ